jgi:hypothetical protein
VSLAVFEPYTLYGIKVAFKADNVLNHVKKQQQKTAIVIYIGF